MKTHVRNSFILYNLLSLKDYGCKSPMTKDILQIDLRIR